MAGSPSEAEVQAQWQNAVDLLEQGRAYADGTVAAAGGLLDTVEQALEGDYLPQAHALAAADYRASMSSIVSPQRALQWLTPLLFEYAKVIGSGYRDTSRIFRALYEHFHTNTYTVQERGLTYGAPSAGGSNSGDGSLSRLTEDENGYNMEACHAEVKTFRCRGDSNSGVLEHAESWEHLGEESSRDSLLRFALGSGVRARAFIRSHHAGAGAGGSLLRNSSFSTYNAASTPKFSGWTEDSGGANISQHTSDFYRSHPGASTDASLRADGDFKISQPLSAWRTNRLDPDRPYFLRVMLNKTVGTGAGGTIFLRLGSTAASVTLAALGAGWQELVIPFDSTCWFRSFNEEGLDVELEWQTSGSGYVLFDDLLFAPWDLIDGTYWFLRGGPTPWRVDDTFTATDTDPGTGKIQRWLFIAGLGYLPAGAAPTFADP